MVGLQQVTQRLLKLFLLQQRSTLFVETHGQDQRLAGGATISHLLLQLMVQIPRANLLLTVWNLQRVSLLVSYFQEW